MLGRDAATLWLLSGLFFLWVVGQALVAVLDVPGLPPMAERYSRGPGLFVIRRRRLGRPLRALSAVCAGAMAARYVPAMALRPARRGPGRSIPIVLHRVLASWYLFALGHDHLRHARPATGA